MRRVIVAVMTVILAAAGSFAAGTAYADEPTAPATAAPTAEPSNPSSTDQPDPEKTESADPRTESAIDAKVASLSADVARRLGAAKGVAWCWTEQGSCQQVFEGGIIFNSHAGTWVVWGDIGAKWYYLSPVGYPTGDEICGLKDGGCYQMFERGTIVWSKDTGAVYSMGGIRVKWATTGSENGRLGYPISDEYCSRGSCSQSFQGGKIVWTADLGSYTLWGGLGWRWEQMGAEYSPLGYPTGDEICGLKDGGCYQMFQGGALLWSHGSGAHSSRNGLRAKWQAEGSENGRLGYPTSEELCWSGVCEQQFQGGTLRWP